MKTIYSAVDYVQNELQDPRRVVFKRTKAEMFCLIVGLFLTAELGLYMLMYN
jgi:hypothetical protein